MKRKRVKNDTEKQICIGCIVNTDFLRNYLHIHNDEYIKASFVRVVINWCKDFYKEYESAPKQHIQEIFKKNKKHLNEDDFDLIEDFLVKLSREFEQMSEFNLAYIQDEALKYVQQRAVEVHNDELKQLNKLGDTEKVKEAMESFSLPEYNSFEYVEPFSDANALREAFEESTQPLFKFKGALGQMVNDYMTKGSLIGVMAPEKRGKTWWLIEFAKRAMAYRLNVAFFGVGDMSQNQMIRRIMVSIAGVSDKEKFCGEVEVPVYGEWIDGDDEDDGKELIVETETEVIKEPLDWRVALKRAKGFKKMMRKGKFRLSCHATDSVSVSDLRNICMQWKKEDGFVPDVILIDYADILAPEPGQREYRHQQNQTWKTLRKFSLDENFDQPLIIIPTQADAKSYNRKTLKRDNFSEDKRKYAHVTGMLALNQTDEEKQKQAMRLSWLLLRDGEFQEDNCCTVLQCLKKGQVHLQSFWKSSDENDE